MTIKIIISSTSLSLFCIKAIEVFYKTVMKGDLKISLTRFTLKLLLFKIILIVVATTLSVLHVIQSCTLCTSLVLPPTFHVLPFQVI